LYSKQLQNQQAVAEKKAANKQTQVRGTFTVFTAPIKFNIWDFNYKGVPSQIRYKLE